MKNYSQKMSLNRLNLVKMGLQAIFIGIFLVLSCSGFSQTTKRIYMIGNSVTDGVNYDGFQALAQSRSNTHIWARHMIPGSPLFLLWGDRFSTDCFCEAPYGSEDNAFRNYQWDAITLQPFDRMLVNDNNEGDVINCTNYANLAKGTSPDVQMYIYGRYPRTANDVAPTHSSCTADAWNALHLRTYTGDWDGTNETRDYYQQLTDASTNANPSVKKFLMIPVGEVMYSLNNKMKAGQVSGYSSIWQVYADGIHVNNIGSYIIACTFYATIYKDNPVGIGVPSQYGSISSSLATIIQQTVWEVVSTYSYAGIAGSSSIAVTGVSLNTASTSVAVNQTYQLNATIAPSNATNQSVTWTSSNTAVATVSTSGLVTGKAAGTATITVKTVDGNKTATCLITVTSSNILVTGVTVAPTTVSIKAGNSSTLSATVAPSNATNTAVTWTSSNTAVATVDATGKISAIAAGSATITVKTIDQNKTATCAVTVLANAAPIAVITATPISGTVPLVVAFNSSASTDPDAGDFILGFEWDFGDGSGIDHSTAPSHTYTSAGTYTVKFRVMDNNNLYSSQVTQTITVAQGTTTNIAPSGIAYAWQNLSLATNNDTKVAKTSLNDNNTTVTEIYPDVTVANYWQAAGVVWSAAQNNITSVKFYHGQHLNDGSDNGCFTANLKVQSSTDGTVWTDVTNWTVTPVYPYNTTASLQSYTLSGAAISNVKGIRVIGQERTNNISWAVKINEIEIIATTATSNIAVTGVSMSPTTASIAVAATQQLTATIAPTNATNKSVNWSSSNTAIATVSTSGLVTGVAAGTATITVTTVDGSKTATCAVTVTASTTPTNIATTGTGKIWQNLAIATSNTGVLTKAGIKDGNITTDIVFTDVTAPNYWQAAGIIWATAQNNINSVKFYNGTAVDLNTNGWFSANIKVQSSTDGTVWTDVTGWSISPAYAYTAAVSNQIYTFSGSALYNIKGIRVVGQLYTVYATSWAIHVKEVQVYSNTAGKSTTIGTFEQNQMKLSFYPNPVQDVLFMNFGNIVNKADISVFDLQGRCLLSKSVFDAETGSIEVNGLINGIYLIKVAIGRTIVINRFVKK